jgi:peptidoglycan/xylan/chitin deacetylase (PgdA/CDA1 family)
VTPLSPLLRLLPRGGAILCLHGIRSGAQPDGGGIHVDASRFAGVLEVAGTVGSIVPLSELVDRHSKGRSTSGLVAITFDDACLSVLRLAAPLLRAHGAPATVFAVRAAAESGGAYWWDRLSLLEPGLLPEERERLACAVGLPDGVAADGGARVRDAIVARHRGALPEAAAAVFTAAEGRLRQVPDYDRSMATTELVELARDPLFDVGVHTVTHRALPLLSDAEIHHEIADCHVWLLEEIRSPLPLLAIPFGLRDDRTRRIAIDAGMQDVLRIAPRTVRRDTTATGYPRFMVSERRSGWKLGAGLAGLQEIARALGVRPGPDDPVMPGA